MKIGITLPQAISDNGVVPRYHDVREVALCAACDGYDSIWNMGHLHFGCEGQGRIPRILQPNGGHLLAKVCAA